MSLKEQLQADLQAALRARDERRRDVLRFTLADLRNAEIAAGGPLDENAIAEVLARAAKRRQESIEAFRKAGRSDLMEKEEAELAILAAYLPVQASRDEIARAALEAIRETGATGPKDIGKVMPLLMRRFQGRADGREVNAVVRELLGS